jgi:hypothetical protein
MQANRLSHRPHRDDCEAVSILDLVAEGLLRPGPVAGFGKSLHGLPGEITTWVPIRGRIGEDDGILTFHGRYEEPFRVVAIPVATRAKRHWYFLCDCGRRARTLYRPTEDMFAMWACWRCHGVRFKQTRQHLPDTRRQLAAIEAGLLDLAAIKRARLQALTLERELRELKRREREALLAAGFEPPV